MKPLPEYSKGLIDLRDWEAISAYLDGALDPKQQAQLEARLEKDAEMRAGLREMRRTRTVLRSQPRLRAPRNFTLTPEMAGLKAGRRSQPFAFPILRLASVLATIFFVVVAVGDLVGRSAKPALVAQAPSAPVVGMGGGGAGGPGFGGGGAEVQMKEAVASEESPTADSSAPVTTTLTVPPEATAVAAVPERNTAPSEQASGGTVQTGAEPVWSVLRVLQVLLALLAVSAGVGALVIRRQARH
jgi:anti-sigma factor RsiW